MAQFDFFECCLFRIMPAILFALVIMVNLSSANHPTCGNRMEANLLGYFSLLTLQFSIFYIYHHQASLLKELKVDRDILLNATKLSLLIFDIVFNIPLIFNMVLHWISCRGIMPGWILWTDVAVLSILEIFSSVAGIWMYHDDITHHRQRRRELYNKAKTINNKILEGRVAVSTIHTLDYLEDKFYYEQFPSSPTLFSIYILIISERLTIRITRDELKLLENMNSMVQESLVACYICEQRFRIGERLCLCPCCASLAHHRCFIRSLRCSRSRSSSYSFVLKSPLLQGFLEKNQVLSNQALFDLIKQNQRVRA